ncbi:hypothetical protein [Cohnella herbarum]|uniref:Uncharacterized protein n=1 Tax=Cohnella herbarum TaxID=2728023 RepID=A0A7Z2VMA0_9BACL|nr:hypothetical protein [Cohnella herbarum]QJD85555.1 hypothetical protein HH215_21805 [Cohnella herbarum]
MKKAIRFSVLALVFAIATVASGCSGSNNEEGSLTIKTGSGKTVLSSESEWPKGLPADIPKMEGMVVTASSVSDSGNITVAVEVEKPLDEVVKLYQDYCQSAGYTQTLEMKEEFTYMYSGTRGQEVFVFNFSLDQEDGRTVMGSIVYESKG